MIRLLFLLFPAVASLAAATNSAATSTAAPAGFDHVKTVGAIAEYALPANGLNVLLLEDHSAPVVTFMVTYRVGSRNEVTGTTGATHLLEHLMFKGSKNFHPGVGKGFDTLMDAIGAINNATTWLDRTNYYENLPSQHLELAVRLEADRMRNLLLREEDRQPEMTVVRNEFERGENDPGEALDKEVTAAAYIAHPYHHSTIGWRSDIEKVSIEKLREFYDTFYWPNNATVTVIGDFAPERALALVKEYFGSIPRSPNPIPEVYTEEPPQTGPRRVIVKRPGEVGAVQVAYKSPHGRHADYAPLRVLASLLSDGKTSRLYRALIDTNLAISADASAGFFHDDSLFNFTALLAPQSTHEQVEKTLLAEVENLKTHGVSPDEVSRAINKLLAGIAYSRDGSFAIAGQINEAIAVGDWTLYVTLPERIKSVTVADVNRVAKTYLNENQSTTGWFIPLSEPAGPAAARSPLREQRDLHADHLTSPKSSYARHPYHYRDPESSAGVPPAPWSMQARTPALLTAAAASTPNPAVGASSARQLQTPSPKPQTLSRVSTQNPEPKTLNQSTGAAATATRRTIAGADVVTLKTSIEAVITLRGALSGGDVFNPPGNSAIADLTAGLLDKGTQRRDKFAIAALLEQAGATLSFGTGTHTLNFAGKLLRQDLPLVLELLAEQLRSPRFDPEEFEKLKAQLIGRYRRAMEDTGFRADNAFERAIFPPGHPNHPPAAEKYLADVEAATLDQVKAFHAANYGPAALRLVAVGDVDDAEIDATLARVFAGWQGGRPIPSVDEAPPLAEGRTVKVMMPGKTSVSLVVGQPSGLRYSEPGYQPLNLATAVFGGGFFSARLLDIIRNREGLTYGIGAGLSADTFADGAWQVSGTFAPELLDQGIASTLRELKRFADEGITAEELATFKTAVTGSYQVQLSTTGGLASALLNALQRGYGPEWLDEFPRRIHALTLEEVNRAIKERLDPDKMVVVLAGSLPPEAASN